MHGAKVNIRFYVQYFFFRNSCRLTDIAAKCY